MRIHTWWTSFLGRRAFAAGLLAMALACPAARGGIYSTNLLANPSFEDYYTDAGIEWQSGTSVSYALQGNNATDRGAQPWLNVGYDVCAIRTDGPGAAPHGDYYGTGGRFAGAVGEIARMRQDIDLLAIGFSSAEIDDAELELDAGGYLSSWSGDDDAVGFSVVLLNRYGEEIAAPYATGLQAPDTWTLYQSGLIAIPAGARYVRFDVEFLKAAGDNNDGRIDDVWVRVYRPSVSAPMVGRNLLANPGFETGTQGWRALAGNARARPAGLSSVPAKSGSWLLAGGQRPLGENQQRAAMLQDVYLEDYGFTPQVLADPEVTCYLRMEGWLYSYGSVGQAHYTIRVYDAFDALLWEYDSGRVRSHVLPAARHRQVILSPDAVRIEFVYDSVDPGGTNLDGYLDEAVLRIDTAPHVPLFEGPTIVGHRGNSIVAPENTVAAMSAARDRGIQMAEFDGRVCASGEIVLMHDATVDRTTDGTGAVSGLTLGQLDLLDAGSWFSQDFAGEPVPTLAETLAALLPEVTPLIERKAGTAAQYAAALAAADAAHLVVVQSFDWVFLDELHALDDSIRLAALGSGALTSVEVQAMQDAGASIVAWSKEDLSPATIALVQAAGLEVFAWTVNNAAEMEALVALNVDGIITDNPEGLAWIATPNSAPLGDLDRDGDVDLADHDALAACLFGPATTLLGGCADADLDGDGDADLADYARFQRQFGTQFIP